MKYRDNEPKVDAGLAASLKALRDSPFPLRAEHAPWPGATLDFDVVLPSGVVNINNVVQLDAHRHDPHLVVVGEKKAHVVPVALIESVIAGTANAEWSLGEELIRDILRDWLTQVQADKDDGR